MDDLDPNAVLDRHALVMAVWLALGLAAAMLLHLGLGTGGWAAVAAGFALLLAAFVGHVIVNAVYRTTFTRRELALGLVVYGVALVTLCLAALLVPGFRDQSFLPLFLGLVAFGVCVVFYMITHFGVRGVYTAFDTIADFRPDQTGDAPARGGRR